MAQIKLKDFCEQNSITYTTGYRWFKAGQIPGAYQTSSGTILVPIEQEIKTEQPSDAISMVFKKTMEFTKNNGTVEDFAAWILSTFSLKLHGTVEAPKYSRQKPKSEEVQKHFQQFLKPKGEKPKPNIFVAPEEALEEIAKADGLVTQEAQAKIAQSLRQGQEISDIPTTIADTSKLTYRGLTDVFQGTPDHNTEGVVIRSVESTPQLNNYTSSSSNALGANLTTTDFSTLMTTFKPTQQELQSAVKIVQAAEQPRRGRKPTKTRKSQ